MVDEDRGALDLAGRGLDAVDVAHLGKERGRDRLTLVVVLLLAEALLRPDAHVDSGLDALEQGVERGVERVAQDERPGHEPDAEDDGQPGEGQAELVGQEAADRRFAHRT